MADLPIPSAAAGQPLPKSALDEATLTACRAMLGQDLLDKAHRLAVGAWEGSRIDFPDVADFPDQAVHASLEALAIRVFMAVYGLGDAKIATRLGDGAIGAMAREAAHRGVAIDRIIGSMRSTQGIWTSNLLAELPRLGAPMADYRSVITAPALAVDSVIGQFIAAYLDEQTREGGNPDARKRLLISTLIAGDAHHDRGVLNRAADGLGLHPSDVHIGLVVLSAVDEANEVADAIRTLIGRDLARARCIIVHGESAERWIWISATAPLPAADVKAFALGLGRNLQWRCALGDPARGHAGFRRTHLQARDLAGLMDRTDKLGLLRFADCRLLLLLAQDPERAAWFVQETLGGLAEDTDRTTEYRHTLRAYLASGKSLNAAASERGVHRNTIVYRLEQAEQALGRSIRHNTQDLQAALLLVEAFGPVVLLPPLDPVL